MKAQKLLLLGALALTTPALGMEEAGAEKERPLTPSRMYDATMDALTGSAASHGPWMLQHWGEDYSGKTVHAKPGETAVSTWTAVGAALSTVEDAKRYVERLNNPELGFTLPQEAFAPACKLIAAQYAEQEAAALAKRQAAKEEAAKIEAERTAKIATIKAKLKAQLAEEEAALAAELAAITEKRQAERDQEMKTLLALSQAATAASKASGEHVDVMGEVDLTPALYKNSLARKAGDTEETLSRTERRRLERETKKAAQRGETSTKGGRQGGRRRKGKK